MFDNAKVVWGEKLDRDAYYPVIDLVPGYPKRTYDPTGNIVVAGIAGKWTGERRLRKAGEYYISGAIPQVYRAPNDLSHKHAIARLVRLEIEVRYDVIERPMLHHRLSQVTVNTGFREGGKFVLIECANPRPSVRHFATERERDDAAMRRSAKLYSEESE